jgi:molybdopterin-guanine dinucleotide biosynthesis protein A
MNISTALLAGGESRRMGKDKPTMLFRGQPLWKIQLGVLRKLKPAEIFISSRIDPPWRPNNVVFVGDKAPSRGPLSGIAAALNETRSTHLLVLAIDMPFMPESYLQSLCGLVSPERGVLPTIDNRAEPVAAIYPREAVLDFQRALARSHFSLQTLTKQLVESGKLRAISVADEARQFFRNLNQPRDMEDGVLAATLNRRSKSR